MKKRIVSLLLALTLCLGFAVPAMADDPYGPQGVGFYLAEKFYSFDEPVSGDGWSYDGNYTMTLSGIQSTYGETEYGVKVDQIQLNNPKKDFTFVVRDGTESKVGYINIIYGGGIIKDSQRKIVTFSGSGTLTCEQLLLDRVVFRDVTLNVEKGFSCWGLTMESGSIKAGSFSMGHTGTTLDGMYSLTGGRIELIGEKSSEYYSGVMRIDGMEEDKIREIIGLFQDQSGQPLQPELKENSVYGGYYAFVKENGTGEYATYAIFDGTGSTASSATGFTDVAADAYYADSVKWAVEQGITSGTSATTFSPDATCSKAEIITLLWRAAGSPDPQNTAVFSDVAADSYYAKAAAWAAEQGMVSGNTFTPNVPCTRLMAVEFMWKQAGSPNAAGASFTDVSSDAVNWAVKQGITSGTGNNTFTPDRECSRAEILTFLYRQFS